MRPTRVDLMGNLVRAFTTLDFSFSLPFFERVSHLTLRDIDIEGLTPTWSHCARAFASARAHPPRRLPRGPRPRHFRYAPATGGPCALRCSA
ncbi:hypothetical protein B0H12DRAFT_1125873, partial [Mycena haematopus]